MADIPIVLFPASTSETWDVTGDGQRFVMGTPEGIELDFPITLVVNWQATR